MNHPDRSGISKAAQLVTAQDAGFATPATLITHDGAVAVAARWAGTAARQRGLLYKAFFCQGVAEGGMVPATRIDPGALPERDLYAASTFQHVIEGQPVRVTVVGEQIFAARIESANRQLDWRPSQQSARMTPVPVPADTAMRLHLFMERSRLEYGALDFIADPLGQWWFLEINPSGQYGFVEIKTGLPITAAIADLLCLPAPRVAQW